MKRPNDGGFTLLEIMLAATITVVIFVILFAAMRLGHRSEEKGMEREDFAQRARILNDRLTWLLRGAYPYFVKKEDKERLHFEAAASSLGFVTSSVDIYGEGPEDMAGLKWVEIYADDGGLKMKERMFFMTAEDTAGAEQAAKEVVLDPTVKKVSFLYFDSGSSVDEGTILEDKEKEETEGQWLESWDTEEKLYLPAAIKVTLLVAFKNGEEVLPPIIAKVRSGHRAVHLLEQE